MNFLVLLFSQLFWMFMMLLKKEKTDPSESSTITAALCSVLGP